MQKGETVGIGWVDGTHVHGAFMFNVVNTMLSSLSTDNQILGVFRGFGPQIDRNRNGVISSWMETPIDWLLWVDSDIVLTPEVFKILCESADKDNAKIMSGIYLIATDSGQNVIFGSPKPSIITESDFTINTNEIVEYTRGGLGITLIHRSVIEEIREKCGDILIHKFTYDDEDTEGRGEDIVFFDLVKSLGIKAYANTSAVVQHLKIMPLDFEFYRKFYLN